MLFGIVDLSAIKSGFSPSIRGYNLVSNDMPVVQDQPVRFPLKSAEIQVNSAPTDRTSSPISVPVPPVGLAKGLTTVAEDVDLPVEQETFLAEPVPVGTIPTTNSVAPSTKQQVLGMPSGPTRKLSSSTPSPSRRQTLDQLQFPQVRQTTDSEKQEQAQQERYFPGSRLAVLNTIAPAEYNVGYIFIDEVDSTHVRGWACVSKDVPYKLEGIFTDVSRTLPEADSTVTLDLTHKLTQPRRDIKELYGGYCDFRLNVGFNIATLKSFQALGAFRFELKATALQTGAGRSDSKFRTFVRPMIWLTLSDSTGDEEYRSQLRNHLIAAVLSLQANVAPNTLIPVHVVVDGLTPVESVTLFEEAGGLVINFAEHCPWCASLRQVVGAPSCVARASIRKWFPMILDRVKAKVGSGFHFDERFVFLTPPQVLFFPGFKLEELPRPAVAAFGRSEETEESAPLADVMVANMDGWPHENIVDSLLKKQKESTSNGGRYCFDRFEELVKEELQRRSLNESLMSLPMAHNMKCHWGGGGSQDEDATKGHLMRPLSVSVKKKRGQPPKPIALVHLRELTPNQCLELSRFPYWTLRDARVATFGPKCRGAVLERHEHLLRAAYHEDGSRLCQRTLTYYNRFMTLFDDTHPFLGADGVAVQPPSLASLVGSATNLTSNCVLLRGYHGRSSSSSCGVFNRVVCPQLTKGPRGDGKDTTKKKSRVRVKGNALVLYSMHLLGTDPSLPEWDNFNYFVNSGVRFGIEESETEMFDGVDYVFFRIHPNVTETPVVCEQRENVRLIWIPPAPCDLCGHAMVLEFLGFTQDPSRRAQFRALYKSVILLNSGTRGPFQAPYSSHWIDVVSMAGESTRPVAASSQNSFRVISSTLFSWSIAPHPQSYFLVVPSSLLTQIFELFRRTCQSDFGGCINDGEVQIGKTVLNAGGSIYVQAYNVTIRSDGDVVKYRQSHFDRWAPNPTLKFWHPCRAVFLKYGGNVWRTGQLPRELKFAVERLTSVFESILLQSEQAHQGKEGEHRRRNQSKVQEIFGALLDPPPAAPSEAKCGLLRGWRPSVTSPPPTTPP
jgi:hypothetical protein